ncbi:MAG: aromatic acid exporter family protein [Bacillota bacterium]
MKENSTKLQNAIKISIAAILAISVAELLHLEFSISAGIIAILTVAPTKRETLSSTAERWAGFIVSLLISYSCFEFFGFTIPAFFVFLICYILVCKWRDWGNTIAVNSVLISHFLTFQEMTFYTLSNELLIFLIGASCGVGVNLSLRENTHYMEKMQAETDEQMREILFRMAECILNEADDDEYTAERFRKIKKAVRRANELAEQNFLNQLKKHDSWDLHYITMRERQIVILYAIYKRSKKMNMTPMTAQAIANFLKKVAAEYHKENTMEALLVEFYRLRSEMRASPLPVTRPEFEARAELYVILGDIEEFLLKKYKFVEERYVAEHLFHKKGKE